MNETTKMTENSGRKHMDTPKKQRCSHGSYLKAIHGGSTGPPNERTTFYQANDRPSNNYEPVLTSSSSQWTKGLPQLS